LPDVFCSPLPKDVEKKLMNNYTDHTELEKATPHIIVEILEYVPNSILIKTIIKKTTGNITVSSLDAGEELSEKTVPFDTFIQIIDGTAEVTINNKKYKLRLGEGIIIPAHSSHCINANEQFKMISSIIKSGYEV
jgi:quercetin dioxygenase-like cupin family protein